jgi:uncharacterized protein (TIGR03435 family)
MTSDEIKGRRQGVPADTKERRQGVPVDSALKQLVRDLSRGSHGEFAAARDRVLDELRATPPHLQRVRVPPLPTPLAGSAPRWRAGAALAAAAAIILAVVTARWSGDDVVYAGDAGRVLTLDDGSTVEMRARSELSIEGADDGIGLRLLAGDIIVNAATQRDGSLYVRTRDMTVAVDGTVFLVKAAESGSLVAVIEGEVRVQDGKSETTLRSGEQMSSRSTPAAQVRPVTEEIAWSRRKDAYLALLQSAVVAAPANQQVSTPPVASGQAAVSTEFEEASVRPCDPNNLPPGGRGGPGAGAPANTFRMTPGRTYGTCLTLATLIRTAYGYGLLEGPPGTFKEGPRGPGGRGDMARYDTVFGFGSVGIFLGSEDGGRVRGGPDWVRSELYSIEAVAPETADAQTMRGPMLRALLERRFGVKVHVETEQIPALKLTVAPGGLKMREGICIKSEGPSGGGRAAQMAAVRRNLDAVRRGVPVTGRCGSAAALNGPNLLMVGAGLPVEPLAEILGEGLEVPVIDQTGIPGTALFNFVLEFALDDSLRREFREQLAAQNELQIASDPSMVPRAPGLVTAVEEQLGLRLERVRTPREFIVIDQAERPTPN